MRLKNLYIRRNASYEANPNALSGTVEFESPLGEVKIAIDEETANKIISLCAEGIVKATQAVSNLMLEDIQQPLIGHVKSSE
jgi:hypothetical protein